MLALLSTGFLMADPSASKVIPAKVVVIPIRGQIAKPELYILRRGLKEAIEDKVDTIVLDMESEFKIGDEVIKQKGELLSLTAQEAVKSYGDPPQPLLGAGIVENLGALLFVVLLKYLPKGGLWDRMVLHAAVAGEPIATRAADLLGMTGVAATALFPSGQVEINGSRYEARLAMGFAEAGTPVIVTGLAEFGLIVEVLS